MKVEIYAALHSFEINPVQSAYFNLCENSGMILGRALIQKMFVASSCITLIQKRKTIQKSQPSGWKQWSLSPGSSFILSNIAREYPNNEILWLPTLWSGTYGSNLSKKLILNLILFYWILVNKYKEQLHSCLPEVEDAFSQYNLWSHTQN